ncbi:hypothetical protein ET464_16345 [Paenibacillus protaetiae]|uniref:Peptidase S8/S53 domain-containing protein n=1 Tax=Paenibacillus protaetiae TaxID=2509456 RepID=A0A4P6F0T5_9BACL|nr:hypothetical protein ET464_16345 [Paenibacillus protaetiae]
MANRYTDMQQQKKRAVPARKGTCLYRPGQAAKLLLVLAFLAGALTVQAPARASAAAVPPADAAAAADEEPDGWLLKWQDPGQAEPLPGTEVLRRQPETAVWLVRPAAEAGADVQQWLARLRSTPGVQYVHPNGRVHMMAAASGAAPGAGASAAVSANDPQLGKQTYLKQIGAIQAWNTVREQPKLVIAVVDTGIDLDHPDLKANLVPGANMIDPGKSPDDDNGHGTNVAGSSPLPAIIVSASPACYGKRKSCLSKR